MFAVECIFDCSIGWLVVLFYSISTLFGSFNIELNHFSISTVFVYTELNFKTVLFQIIQFSVSTVSKSKTVPFQTILFDI